MHSREGRGGECTSWFPNRCDVTAKWTCYIRSAIERVPKCPICRRKFIKRCVWIWKGFINSLQLNISWRRTAGKMNSFRKHQSLGRGWLVSGGTDVHVLISEVDSSWDFGVNGRMWDSRGWSILIQAVDTEDQSCRLFLVPHFRLLFFF